MAQLSQGTGLTPSLPWQPTHLPFVDAPSEPNVTVHDSLLHALVPWRPLSLFLWIHIRNDAWFQISFSALSVRPLHFFLLLTLLACGAGWQ